MGSKSRRSEGGTIARVFGWVLVGVAVVVVGFRWRWRPLMDAVRHLNKRVLNPAMLSRAGARGFYASVVYHVGRRSGADYATPVVAVRAGSEFYVPLPYGVDVDWCRNLLAAGGGVIEFDGERYRVEHPRIVPAARASAHIPAMRRAWLAAFGVEDYLRTEIEPTGVGVQA